MRRVHRGSGPGFAVAALAAIRAAITSEANQPARMNGNIAMRAESRPRLVHAR